MNDLCQRVGVVNELDLKSNGLMPAQVRILSLTVLHKWITNRKNYLLK